MMQWQEQVTTARIREFLDEKTPRAPPLAIKSSVLIGRAGRGLEIAANRSRFRGCI